MKPVRPVLLTYMLIVTLLAIAGCSVRSDSASSPAPTATTAPSPIPTVTPQADTTTEEELNATTYSLPAGLLVRAGSVEVKRAGQTAFAPVQGSATVNAGDVIRTQSDGIVLISLLPNTDTTLYENSELVIISLDQDAADDSYVVALQQLAGLAFHRVNFSNQNSIHEVSTPFGVATVQGTGYWVDLPALSDFADFAAVSGAVEITPPGGTQPQSTTIIQASGSGGGDMADAVRIDATGQVLEIVFDLFCGDGICDEYSREAELCPADCG